MKFAAHLMPIAVVSVVLMMMVPLPNVVLDALIALNLALSLALLLSSVSIKRPETFTVLPSILLISTLFRLGLNVATTRQILSAGEAPETVQAFGHFVVGGDLVVGAVVFLIITIVQFLVISKGAERVAEVAARFTLDAMPGKQISIDADLRAGVISLAEARERRVDLQSESRLYGALDGAMKFIKGDAIAGLIITALNIIAGILIGVSVHSLALSEAAKRYTIFTIGDGLAAQLPALLVSFAAGLAVTRVSGRGEDSIGGDLLKQLTAEPSVPVVTALLLFGIGMLPGIPFLPFLVWSGVSLLISLALKGARLSSNEIQIESFRPRGTAPLVLHLSPRALTELQAERQFIQKIQNLRSEIFREWGIVIPEPEIEVGTDQELSASILRFGVMLDGYQGEPGDFADQFFETLKGCFYAKSELFLDDTQTRLILEAYQGRCEDLINSVIPSILPVTRLTGIFRELCAENIPLSDIPGILQGVLEWHHESRVPEALKSELLMIYVRRKLRRLIASRFPKSEVLVIELGDELELLISNSILEQGSGLLPVTRELLRDEIVTRALELNVSILLTAEISRVTLSKILRGSGITVLAREELENRAKSLGVVRMQDGLRLAA